MRRPMPIRTLLLPLLLAAAPASAEEPATSSPLSEAEARQLSEAEARQWAVRMARMEGAAVNVTEAATELASTARRIADSGRLHGLSDLAADATQLDRRVVSLKLATEVLMEDIQRSSGD